MVEFLVREHIAVCVDWTKHDILCHILLILIVEDEYRVALHVDPHDIVDKHLQAIVEIDHAELRYKLVIAVS